MLIPMLYFLFLPDVWVAFPYVLILVTNTGTMGRYRSIDANMYISLRICLLGRMRSISVCIEIGHKVRHCGWWGIAIIWSWSDLTIKSITELIYYDIFYSNFSHNPSLWMNLPSDLIDDQSCMQYIIEIAHVIIPKYLLLRIMMLSYQWLILRYRYR